MRLVSRGSVMLPRVAYWLMPSDRDRSPFQKMINTLANTYGAPVFEPHVTIFVGERSDNESPGDVIDEATAGMEGVWLRIDRIRHTSDFTKTLFVQFHPSHRLSALSDALRQRSAKPSDYVLDPHLSLIYHSMSEAEKEKVAASLIIPEPDIYFDEVRAIATPMSVRDRQDVESWKLLYRKRLEAVESSPR